MSLFIVSFSGFEFVVLLKYYLNLSSVSRGIMINQDSCKATLCKKNLLPKEHMIGQEKMELLVTAGMMNGKSSKGNLREKMTKEIA